MAKTDDSDQLLLSRRHALIASSSAALSLALPQHGLADVWSPTPTKRASRAHLGQLLPPVPPPSEAAHYVATLTLGSTIYTFESMSAVDQGNYLGQFVQQKSLMASLANCPFTVFFRPDLSGKRDEVVVELGKMWSGTPAHFMTPYTLSVTKNGAPLFTQTITYHWWWSRWRWQSAPRPVVAKASDLIASKKLLPHNSKWLYGWKGWTKNIQFAGPMDTAGLETAVGTGGDRPEIGPVTLPQADYIVNGTPLAWSTMIAQAEASASMPMHVRDEKTGQWFDNQANPYYSLLAAAGPPLIPNAPLPPVPPGQVSGNNVDARFMNPEAAHNYPLVYVPYLFTDDPYYLEELQAMALWHIVVSSYHSSKEKLPGLAYPGETRATAWGLRSVAQAALVTPATTPSWINSQAHWKQNLADNRVYLQRFMDSPALIHKLFRAYTRSDHYNGFEVDYLMIVLAWMVRMGFTEWADGYAWAMGAVMPLVTDGSGWLKGWPDPYFFSTYITDPGYPTLLISDTSQDANTPTSWTALFQRYVAQKGGTNDPTLQTYPPPWDGISIKQTQSGAGYFLWRQGTLHLASGLGIVGAAAATAWIDSQIPSVMTKYRGNSDPRWSFDTR
jgi:hypothetical protein